MRTTLIECTKWAYSISAFLKLDLLVRPILFGVVAVAQLTVDFLREPTADVADGDENIAELKDEVDKEVSASRLKFAFKYCCIELIEFCNYFEIKLFKVKL